MREGPRQIAVGTVLGALLGVTIFFALAAQRIVAGDDLVLAFAWGLAGLTGTIILGRMVDAFLWAPALMARPASETTSESPADTEAKTSGIAPATRGTAVDLKLDDDTDTLTPAAAAPQPDNLTEAA